jgi:tetratricopeptide (TPR) repeat protein
MKQQVPLVRNINYPVFFLQLLLVTATIVGFVWLFWPEWGTGSLVGLIVLVVYVKGMQWYLMRYHQAALKLIRAGKFDEALVPLQKALEFYTEHPGLDRWRHVLMATASRFSLREVAMMNIAYCFGQIGDKEKMIKHYERLASEYPDNMAAQNTLRFIDTLQSD